jgi:hypothetical protein
MMGLRKNTIAFSGYAIIGASLKAYVTPIVLGRISEKNSIERVKIAEKRMRFSSPNNLAAAAPATEAPMVFAIVLSVKIAVMGSSMSALRCRRCSAAEFPLFLSISTWLDEIEYRTASHMEQSAETVMASDTEIINVWSRDILLSWLKG